MCSVSLLPGHVRYLQTARREGDVLIVALNEINWSVGSAARPIFQRPKLSSLACVDAVVVFDEPTPAEIIGAIR